jgi:iron complex outermembrane recepter protein
MLKSMTFRSTLAAVAWTISFSAHALADPKQINIPAGDLVRGLEILEKQAAIELVFQPNQLKSFHTMGVTGTYEPKDAVRILLKGTPLELRTDPTGAMVITDARVLSTQKATQGPEGTSASSQEGTKSYSEGFRVAQVGPGTSASSTTLEKSEPTSEKKSGEIQEVIVTAQKRSERLEDVPVAVTVVDAASMVQQNALSLQDYYATVPGVAINDQGNGRLSITMRGLNTGDFGNPTVGITIDDVPIGDTDTAVINGAQFVPELDPADLQHIEFLKGPQGTLYGASSLGGVMRYVTAVPDLNSISGHIEVDGSGVSDGAGGYGVRGTLNAPVVPDMLAVRLSAFDRQDPGFVDDPAHGRSDVNGVDVSGAHVAALLRVTQDVSLRLSALVQDKNVKGDSTVDTNYLYEPTAGCLCQSRMPGTGHNNYQLQLYSANLNIHFEQFDLTSITGYSLNHDEEDFDETPLYGPYAEALFNVQGASLVNVFHNSKFTQEVRLSSLPGSKLEWQLGGFYTYEDNSTNHSQIIANDLATGAFAGLVLDFPYPTTYTEYAGFANATYHFTDRFNVQVGGRESHNSQRYEQDITGPLLGGLPDAYTTRSHDNSFTFLVTPQYRFSDALMAYARVASGYMAGGPNTPFVPGAPIPLTFAPSTTVNYELGLKSRAFDRRLSVDADIFYIDWSKIQLIGETPLLAAYVFNGGSAKSQGIEIATEFKPVDSFTISASGAYTDAELTSNAGNGFPGLSGDPLPYSSKFSGSVAAEERFRITRSVSGFVGATVAYVGKRYEGFPAIPGAPQPSIPDYTYGNLQIGMVADGYTVTAFAKNVTNEQGILRSTQITGSTPTSGLWETNFITPRTIGLSASKSF